MNSSDADFFMISGEGYGLETPRTCSRGTNLQIGRHDATCVHVSPPILYENHDVHQVFLAARHKGASVITINEWPVDVYVAVPRGELTVQEGMADPSSFKIIAWAELHRTAEDAEAARHDPWGRE